MLKKLKKKVKVDNKEKIVEKKKVLKKKKVEKEIAPEPKKVEKKTKLIKKVKEAPKEVKESKIEKAPEETPKKQLSTVEIKNMVLKEVNGKKYVDEKAMIATIPNLAMLFRKGSKLNGIPVRYIDSKEYSSGGWHSVCHYILHPNDSFAVLFEAKFYGSFHKKDVGIHFITEKDVKICVRD